MLRTVSSAALASTAQDRTEVSAGRPACGEVVSAGATALPAGRPLGGESPGITIMGSAVSEWRACAAVNNSYLSVKKVSNTFPFSPIKHRNVLRESFLPCSR